MDESNVELYTVEYQKLQVQNVVLKEQLGKLTLMKLAVREIPYIHCRRRLIPGTSKVDWI